MVPFLDVEVMLPIDPTSSKLLDNSELCYQINLTSTRLQDYECMNVSPRLDNAQHLNDSTITHQQILYTITIIMTTSSCLSHQHRHNITSAL